MSTEPTLRVLVAGAAPTRVARRQRAELLAFFTETMTREVVGPVSGRRHRAGHFLELMEERRR